LLFSFEEKCVAKRHGVGDASRSSLDASRSGVDHPKQATPACEQAHPSDGHANPANLPEASPATMPDRAFPRSRKPGIDIPGPKRRRAPKPRVYDLPLTEPPAHSTSFESSAIAVSATHQSGCRHSRSRKGGHQNRARVAGRDLGGGRDGIALAPTGDQTRRTCGCALGYAGSSPAR